MATELYPGFWYTTSLYVAGAHKTPDGRMVGVYERAGWKLEPYTDGDGNFKTRRKWHPHRIVIQAEDGHDLLQLVGRDTLRTVAFTPEELPDLQLLEHLDHLPEGRKAGIAPGTKVQAYLPE